MVKEGRHSRMRGSKKYGKIHIMGMSVATERRVGHHHGLLAVALREERLQHGSGGLEEKRLQNMEPLGKQETLCASEMAEESSAAEGQSARGGLATPPAGSHGVLLDGLSFTPLDANGVPPFPRSPKLQRKIAIAAQPSQVNMLQPVRNQRNRDGTCSYTRVHRH
ncbi:hypothetical protein EYF80_062969 [Liparis tanakae]|uniref:Uncharacterized protein n=1 Tax=Liparis tanakae TaxID=230148 RepID=A0A4Z2EDR5_9TELE|nr:hypothetical protein EYF80_062969 [Liparis tanakae]